MGGEGKAPRPPTPELESALDSSPPPAPLARGPPPYVTGASAGIVLPPPSASPQGHPSYSPFPLETGWPAPVPRPLPLFVLTEGMAPVHSNYPWYPPLYQCSYWGQAYSPGVMPIASQALSAYLYMSDANVYTLYPHYSSGFSQQYLPQAVHNNSVDVGSTGHHGSISYAVHPGEPYVKIDYRQRVPKKAKLFVFYVANEMTNEALYRLFEPHGTILNLRIATENHTGRGKGYAFVDYASAASAENAIHHLDRKMVMGKRLMVEHKKGGGPRSPAPLRQHHSSPALGHVGRPGARRAASPYRHDSAPEGWFADMEDMRNSLPDAQ